MTVIIRMMWTDDDNVDNADGDDYEDQDLDHGDDGYHHEKDDDDDDDDDSDDVYEVDASFIDNSYTPANFCYLFSVIFLCNIQVSLFHFHHHFKTVIKLVEFMSERSGWGKNRSPFQKISQELFYPQTVERCVGN